MASGWLDGALGYEEDLSRRHEHSRAWGLSALPRNFLTTGQLAKQGKLELVH